MILSSFSGFCVKACIYDAASHHVVYQSFRYVTLMEKG